jgi:hypothetical protein
MVALGLGCARQSANSCYVLFLSPSAWLNCYAKIWCSKWARPSGARVGVHGEMWEMGSPPSPSSLTHPNTIFLLVQWRRRPASHQDRGTTSASRGGGRRSVPHLACGCRWPPRPGGVHDGLRGPWLMVAPEVGRVASRRPSMVHTSPLPPVDLERWPRLGRSSDDRGSGSSPLASDRDRRQTSSEARRGTPSGGTSLSLVTTIGTERPESV